MLVVLDNASNSYNSFDTALQVVEDHAYSKAADVYSFGIIMWEMMTWDVPWEELNAYQVTPTTLCFEQSVSTTSTLLHSMLV